MATSRLVRWDSNNLFSSNAVIYTRMFDMGDVHASKKITAFLIAFTGETTQSYIGVKVEYRFNSRGSWLLFGTGATAGKDGRLLKIFPSYNSNSAYQMERTLSEEDVVPDKNNEPVRLTDVKKIQFKLSFYTVGKIEINDYSVEYRTMRRTNINEPTV